MIIDYLNRDHAVSCGMEITEEHGQIRFRNDSGFSGVTFINFFDVNFEDMTLTDCTFKDCHEISVHECTLEGCTFCNVSGVYAQFSMLKGCTFEGCCSSYDSLLTLESEGEIDGCTFQYVTVLGEDGHIIHSIYDGKDKVRPIRNCRFEDCEVESGEMICCEYLVSKVVYRKEKVNNVDRASCCFD